MGRVRVHGECLEFISKILPDGRGTVDVEKDNKFIYRCYYDLTTLSISQETFIAQNGFTTYVVKIK